jgi:hypothetical protein
MKSFHVENLKFLRYVFNLLVGDTQLERSVVLWWSQSHHIFKVGDAAENVERRERVIQQHILYICRWRLTPRWHLGLLVAAQLLTWHLLYKNSNPLNIGASKDQNMTKLPDTTDVYKFDFVIV